MAHFTITAIVSPKVKPEDIEEKLNLFLTNLSSDGEDETPFSNFKFETDVDTASEFLGQSLYTYPTLPRKVVLVASPKEVLDEVEKNDILTPFAFFVVTDREDVDYFEPGSLYDTFSWLDKERFAHINMYKSQLRKHRFAGQYVVAIDIHL